MSNPVIDDFENMLECGESYDLKEMVNDFPEEQRAAAAKKLIETEIKFFQSKGWTYNLARHEDFPELRDFIVKLANGSTELSLVDFNSSTDGERYTAQCDYLVSRWPFAEGGQGAMYRARDTVLGDREVAIKVLKRPEDEKRFRQEASITAGLDHPGVAAVYALSENGTKEDITGQSVNGRPFYVMRMIDGKPLDDEIADFHNTEARRKRFVHNPQFVRLIESLISACHTVAYAHSNGVLHCDIKPQNIMCGKFGATIVLDWGSAVSAPKTERKANENIIECPEWTNDSLYTAAYASPEQKSGDVELDERSDVYSLGATLYQIISGCTPIDERDYESRLKRDQVGNVRSIQTGCPKSLNAICVKALKVRRDDRYLNPIALAEDLGNWLRGEEIVAKPDNVLDKIFRTAVENRVVTGIALLSAILLAAAGWKFKADQYKGQLLQSNFDSGFSLIENICKPLENGELQNPKELRSVVNLVDQHCDANLETDEPICDA